MDGQKLTALIMWGVNFLLSMFFAYHYFKAARRAEEAEMENSHLRADNDNWTNYYLQKRQMQSSRIAQLEMENATLKESVSILQRTVSEKNKEIVDGLTQNSH